MVPWIVAFFSALGAAIVPLGLRLLVGLGVGVVVYHGIGTLLDSVELEIAGAYGDLMGDAAAILDMLGFRVALSVILSAFSVRLAIAGVNMVTGSLSSTTWRPPTSGG